MNSDYDSLWEAAWNEAASHGPGFRSRYALILRQLQHHGQGSRLIDVGAGRGHLLLAIAAHYPKLQLDAVEGAPESVQILRSLNEVSEVFSSSSDSPDRQPPPRSYSSVICSEVLEHVDGHEALLDTLVELLEPSGRLFLTVPLRQDLWTQVDDAVGHKRRYQHGELAQMCRDRGLEVEEDLALGFPFYNSYYRLLGSRSPEQTSNAAQKSLLHRPLASLLTLLFRLENHVSTPLGGRGMIVAKKTDE